MKVKVYVALCTHEGGIVHHSTESRESLERYLIDNMSVSLDNYEFDELEIDLTDKFSEILEDHRLRIEELEGEMREVVRNVDNMSEFDGYGNRL